MIPSIPPIQNPERYSEFNLPREKVEAALNEAFKKVDLGIEHHGFKFPNEYSKNNVYATIENTSGWGNGFWSGILWHAYQLTGDEKYKNVVIGQIPSYTKRITEKIGVNHHDMGFLFSLSCVAAWKLCGNEEAKAAALMAAEHLTTRYRTPGDFIQAWGNVNDPKDNRLIIDCLLNIPLLYWASEVTGDQKYDEMAWKHFNTTISVCCRPDASTYHTYYFDAETGAPVKGVTHQGAFDESAWARGQAWGIYGPMLTRTYKESDGAMQVFKATSSYFLNHLPEDYVPFWDLCFTDGADEPRDTSSAAIACCGMLEALKHMDKADPLYSIFTNAVNRIMNSLIDNYTSKDVPEANGLLLHQTYAKPQGIGIDEMNIWGDYFYMEALHRLVDPDWKLYW
ncbi:MAG: glycoside hydrolase family 88 protein [Clostridia bacterium]|nr:glycoside hydrolase family 88 protein [Clostridia bacterium]